jgi:hypothetical protein
MFGCSINGLKDGGKEMTEVLRKTLEENKFLFFKNLYMWTAVYGSLWTISYSDFLVLFDIFS